MTNEQVIEIDEHLEQKGWRYNAQAERFETLPTGDADAAYVDWTDVLAAMPHLGLTDLEAYQDMKWRPLEKELREGLLKKFGDQAEWGIGPG